MSPSVSLALPAKIRLLGGLTKGHGTQTLVVLDAVPVMAYRSVITNQEHKNIASVPILAKQIA